MPWNSNHNTKVTKNIYMPLWWATMFFSFFLLVLNKPYGLENIYNIKCTLKRHVLYIIEIFKTLHIKGITYRKEGMLNNRSELCWMKSHRQIRPWQNASPNEDMLSTFTERYEHATFDKTNRKELNRTRRLPSDALFLCFTDHAGSFSYLIHLQSHLSRTKIIHSFFFSYIIHHSERQNIDLKLL